MLRKSNGPRGQSKNAVPEEVARLGDVMAAYPEPWALAGGWAVDAWLGRVTRDHLDTDIAAFMNDHQALLEHFDGWQLIGHDEGMTNQGGREFWDGRQLVLPAHIHARSPDESGPLPERFDEVGARVVFPVDGFWLDICLCERSSGDLVLNAEPRLAVPLAECIRESGWGLPTLAPEVILFFKMTMYVGTKNHLRPHDEADFVALLPLLTKEQGAWLREAVSRVYVGEHPWTGRM